MIWRSTLLNLAAQHCSRALDFAEAGAPYDRERFAVGVAAHAILEEIGKESVSRGRYLTTAEVEEVAQRTGEELIREGRDFEGRREPPLRSDLVWQGRDLAIEYARECPLAPDGRYEQAASVTRDWLPCPVGEGAYLMARLDFLATRVAGLDLMADDDEDGPSGPVLLVRDFKSSWTADEAELWTLQRKIQALVAWANFGEGHEILRLEVVNFRLRRTYELVVLPRTEEGEALMARWRRDVESEIRARDQQKGPDGRRPATPGIGCLKCPDLAQCDDGLSWLRRVVGSDRAEDLARELAVLEARRETLLECLKEAAGESPIALEGGSVGYAPKEQRVPSSEAPDILAGLWARRMHGRDAEGILAALPGLFRALKLGKSQLGALLSHLYQGGAEERERKHRALQSMLTTKLTKTFGVHRANENEGASDE